MSKAVKVLLSVVIVFAGIVTYGMIAAIVIGPERLATSGVHGTVTLLVTVVVYGILLRFLWAQPKDGLVDSKPHSKTSPLKIVGGVLLVALCLIGGLQNIGSNPASNLSTLLVMAALIYLSLGLTRIFNVLRRRKRDVRSPGSTDDRHVRTVHTK